MERELREAIENARRSPYTISLLTNYLDATVVSACPKIPKKATTTTTTTTTRNTSAVKKSPPLHQQQTSEPTNITPITCGTSSVATQAEFVFVDETTPRTRSQSRHSAMDVEIDVETPDEPAPPPRHQMVTRRRSSTRDLSATTRNLELLGTPKELM